MRVTMRALVDACFAVTAMALAWLAAPGDVAANTVRTDQSEVRLLTDVEALGANGAARLALEIRAAPGWHTYWLNPGDSGFPLTIDWTAPEGVEIGEIRWPAPKRYAVPPMVNYGYADVSVFLSDVRLPADWPIGEPVRIAASARWLICEEICIPETGEFELSIPTAAETTPDASVGLVFLRAERAAPRAWTGAAQAAPNQDGVILTLAAADAPFALTAVDDAYFFPVQRDLTIHAAPQAVANTENGLTVALPADLSVLAAMDPPRLEGVVRVFEGAASRAYRVSADLDADALSQAAAAGWGTSVSGGGLAALAPPTPTTPTPTPPAPAALGLATALLFGVLGGLILNLMPCVFPVLALKALALARHADHAQTERLRQGLAYGAGVLATFWLIGAALIALKAAGASVGWGYQLQSPLVVGLTVYALFAIGLNFSGVFEAPSMLQNLGSGAANRAGVGGSFFTGALAVAVASPCTAPFMAVSMGYALGQNALTGMLFFTALAIGFAAPLTLLSAAPGWARRLPKPGPWMVRFKEFLAFPMYLAAAYFFWVFMNQTSPNAAAALIAGLVLMAMAAWIIGAVGSGETSSGRGRRAATIGAAAALLGALAALGPAAEGGAHAETPRQVALGEPYDPARLAQLRAEGRTVFVNLTADWCVSCKYNEQVVLNTSAFAEALGEADAVYLEGDWTRPDADILAMLEAFGRSGVPLYVVYRPGAAPEVLPQILSQSVVGRALRGDEG